MFNNLENRYKYLKNFSRIVSVIKESYPDIFRLKEMNEYNFEVKNSLNYVVFFEDFFSKEGLGELWHDRDIQRFIYEYLEQTDYTKNFFIPKPNESGEDIPDQIGFLEKLHTNKLNMYEPLQFIDIKRACVYFNKKGSKFKFETVAFANLSEIKPDQQTVFLFNLHPKRQMSQWVVAKLKSENKLEIYSESPIFEPIKKIIQNLLGSYEFIYKGGDSALSASSGYMALCECMESESMCSLKKDSDFLSILHEFIYCINYHTKIEDSDSSQSKYKNDIFSGLWGKSADCILGSQVHSIKPGQLYDGITKYEKDKSGFQNTLKYSLYGLDNALGKNISSSVGKQHVGWLTEGENHSVQIKIPKITNYLWSEIENYYKTHSRANAVGGSYLAQHVLEYDYKSPEEKRLAAVIITFFRYCARKTNLKVDICESDYKDFELNGADISLLTDVFLDNNPFICTLESKHQFIKERIAEPLAHVFARNKWLKINDYKPPMVDDFWGKAAYYYLRHLVKTEDVLDSSNETFRSCVQKMHKSLFEKVFEALSDDAERDLLEKIYEKTKPTFYISCDKPEKNCLTLLEGHIRSGNYFPYTEICFSLEGLEYEQLYSFLSSLNGNKDISSVLIEGFKGPRWSIAQINSLSQAALDNKWIFNIKFVDIDPSDFGQEQSREIKNAFSQLNNIIIYNKNQIIAQKKLSELQQFSATSLKEILPCEQKDSNEESLYEEIKDSSDDEGSIGDAEDKEWNIAGHANLQVQQQQAIQQERQITKESQLVRQQAKAETYLPELISFDNIDKNFTAEEFKKLEIEFKVDERFAPLRVENESILKGFFRTWINSNPNEHAPNVIRYMAKEAIRYLLKHQHLFTSGINADKLPKGFYLQKSYDGWLVLNYDIDFGYYQNATPFTVRFSHVKNTTETWEGDFRQLNFDAYLHGSSRLNKADVDKHICLFAALQPKEDYKAEELNNQVPGMQIVDETIHINGKTTSLENLVLVLSMYQHYGMEGVDGLLVDVSKYILSKERVTEQLFASSSEKIKVFMSEVKMPIDMLKALGQVYYSYRQEGLDLLINKFIEIQSSLGKEFFKSFQDSYLSTCNNFNCMMDVKIFESIDDINKTLIGEKKKSLKGMWQEYLVKHSDATGFSDIADLWNAFMSFDSILGSMGLKEDVIIEKLYLKSIKSANMIVIMDRISECLKRLFSTDSKRTFLMNIDEYGLNFGDVYYAIVHEKFQYVDQELELQDFKSPCPNYASDIANVYKSFFNEKVFLKRALASMSNLNLASFTIAKKEININNKHQLIMLDNTTFSDSELNGLLECKGPIYESIVKKIHEFVYIRKHRNLDILWSSIKQISLMNDSFVNGYMSSKELHPVILEAITLLYKKQQCKKNYVTKFINIWSLLKEDLKKDKFFESIFKLSVLFESTFDDSIEKFVKFKEFTKCNLQDLFKHLMTVNLEESKSIENPENWQLIISYFEMIDQEPQNMNYHSGELIKKLEDKGLVFRLNKRGKYKTLTEGDKLDLRAFIDHEERLDSFFKSHILVESAIDVSEQIQPIINFLSNIQSSATYLNELEPLLSTLEEKTEEKKYWTSKFLLELFNSLLGDSRNTAFPINMLALIIKEDLLSSKKMDFVADEMDKDICKKLKCIVNSEKLTRYQKDNLALLSVKFNYSQKDNMLQSIIDRLEGLDECDANAVIDSLVQCKNFEELIFKTSVFENFNVGYFKNSNKAIGLCMRFSSDKTFKKIMNFIINIADDNKRNKIMYIIAFSSLDKGLMSDKEHSYELLHYLEKLFNTLNTCGIDLLDRVIPLFDLTPSPRAQNLIEILNADDFDIAVSNFNCSPFTDLRPDYGMLDISRREDLIRMLKNLKISVGEIDNFIEDDQSYDVVGMLIYLNALESRGQICKMSREDIAGEFKELSRKTNISNYDKAKMYALAFEALFRTTRKYPHLAQKFTLFCGEVLGCNSNRVVKLSVGEGKSHIIALRAVIHAGSGRKVDILTSKDSLASRDYQDYRDFYYYLGIKAAFIKPSSRKDEYDNADVNYTKIGDFSLFFDRQAILGDRLDLKLEKRVALFDEFDFTIFEEGAKTNYNYSIIGNKLPKELDWFYKAVNSFIDEKKQTIENNEGKVSRQFVKDFVGYLIDKAGKIDTKLEYVEQFIDDDQGAVQILTSSYIASKMERDRDFTISRESIVIGEESYPMQEIVPLTSDSQRVKGATFSNGVHQFLAVRLNTIAKENSQPQNFHVHAESFILSSQVAESLLTRYWGTIEGFTGTVSSLQTQKLNDILNACVIEFPTNMDSKRKWNTPKFLSDKDSRYAEVESQICKDLDGGKSVLVCCENDIQVNEFKKEFSDYKSLKKYEIMYYINEDSRSPRQILLEKELFTKENTKPVALFASSFGRGDNTGTEVVYILGVKSQNECIQKGGRTARNGAYGEVHQFYLEEEVKSQCLDVTQMLNENFLGMSGFEGEADLCKIHKKLLSNLELIQSYNNENKREFDHVKSYFTYWCLEYFSSINDSAHRSSHKKNIVNALKILDKRGIKVVDQVVSFINKKIESLKDCETIEFNLPILQPPTEYKVIEKGEPADIEDNILNKIMEISQLPVCEVTIDKIIKIIKIIPAHRYDFIDKILRLKGKDLVNFSNIIDNCFINTSYLGENNLPKDLMDLMDFVDFDSALFKEIFDMCENKQTIIKLMSGRKNNQDTDYIKYFKHIKKEYNEYFKELLDYEQGLSYKNFKLYASLHKAYFAGLGIKETFKMLSALHSNINDIELISKEHKEKFPQIPTLLLKVCFRLKDKKNIEYLLANTKNNFDKDIFQLWRDLSTNISAAKNLEKLIDIISQYEFAKDWHKVFQIQSDAKYMLLDSYENFITQSLYLCDHVYKFPELDLEKRIYYMGIYSDHYNKLHDKLNQCDSLKRSYLELMKNLFLNFTKAKYEINLQNTLDKNISFEINDIIAFCEKFDDDNITTLDKLRLYHYCREKELNHEETCSYIDTLKCIYNECLGLPASCNFKELMLEKIKFKNLLKNYKNWYDLWVVIKETQDSKQIEHFYECLDFTKEMNDELPGYKGIIVSCYQEEKGLEVKDISENLHNVKLYGIKKIVDFCKKFDDDNITTLDKLRLYHYCREKELDHEETCSYIDTLKCIYKECLGLPASCNFKELMLEKIKFKNLLKNYQNWCDLWGVISSNNLESKKIDHFSKCLDFTKEMDVELPGYKGIIVSCYQEEKGLEVKDLSENLYEPKLYGAEEIKAFYEQFDDDDITTLDKLKLYHYCRENRLEHEKLLKYTKILAKVHKNKAKLESSEIINFSDYIKNLQKWDPDKFRSINLECKEDINGLQLMNDGVSDKAPDFTPLTDEIVARLEQGNHKKVAQLCKGIDQIFLLDDGKNNQSSITHKLKREIYTEAKKYDKCWFKNKDRKDSLSKLMTLIQDTTHNTNDLISEIIELKKSVINADIENSKKRWFSKLHRFGKSRYYNVLDNILKILYKDSFNQDSEFLKEAAEKYRKNNSSNAQNHIEMLKQAISSKKGFFDKINNFIYMITNKKAVMAKNEILKDNASTQNIIDAKPILSGDLLAIARGALTTQEVMASFDDKHTLR